MSPRGRFAALGLAPALASLLTTLASCGGGGGGAEPPAPADLAALQAEVAERVRAALDAVRAAPGEAGPWERLGMVYQANGMPSLAVRAHDVAEARAPEDPRIPYRRALARLALGAPEAALEDLERAIALAPAQVVPRWRLGEVLLERGELDAAGEAFRAAAEAKPAFLGSWLGLARVHLLRDENEEALAVLGRVLDAVPRHRYARELRRSALRQAGADVEELAGVRGGASTYAPQVHDPWEEEVLAHRFEPRGRRAARLLARDRPAKAAELLEAELAEAGEDVTLLLHLADARAALGELAEARRLLERCLALEPGNVRVHESLADVLLRRGEDEAALDVVGRALELAPDLGRLHVERSRLLRRLGRPAEAADALREALQRDARDPALWLRLAASEARLERFAAAAEAFERAASSPPLAGEALLGLAGARLALGEHAAAAEALRRAEATGEADAERAAELRAALGRAGADLRAERGARGAEGSDP